MTGSKLDLYPMGFVALALVLVAAGVYRAVEGRLKSRHQQKWAELNKHTRDASTPYRDAWRRLRFVWAQHGSLGDAKLSTLCYVLVALQIAIFAILTVPQLREVGAIHRYMPPTTVAEAPRLRRVNPIPPQYLLLPMAALVIGQAWLWGRIRKRIRDAHPVIWERLGKPYPFLDWDQGKRRAMTNFVNTGAYAGLNDPELDRLKNSADWCGRIAVALIVVTLGYIFLFVDPGVLASSGAAK